MGDVYTLEWRDGRKENFFCREADFYVLPDQTIVPLETVPAWCRICQELQLCEQIESEAALRKEISDLSDPESATWQAVAKNTAPWYPEDWRGKREAQLRHVLLRRLAPSCLCCGQRQVSFFKQGEWVPHFLTGEEVRLDLSGMSTGPVHARYYDVDGNPLELSDKERMRLHQSSGKKDT